MSEIEKDIQKKVADMMNQALERALIPDSAFGKPAPLAHTALEDMYKRFPKRPLSLDELLQKMIEKPDYILICGYNAYLLARELRKRNVRLKRERKGVWAIASKSGKTMGTLYISKHAVDWYAMPRPELPKWELKFSESPMLYESAWRERWGIKSNGFMGMYFNMKYGVGE